MDQDNLMTLESRPLTLQMKLLCWGGADMTQAEDISPLRWTRGSRERQGDTPATGRELAGEATGACAY